MASKKLLRLIFIGFLIWGFFKGLNWAKLFVEKQWPMISPDLLTCLAESTGGQLNKIEQPGNAIELQWHNSNGNVSGIVRAWKWKNDEETFVRVQGPVPCEYKTVPPYTMVSIYIAHNFKVETIGFDLEKGGKVSAWRNWPVKQKLQKRYFDTKITDGQFELTLRLPEGTQLGNIVFSYEEYGSKGWVATEKRNASRHDNILEWELQ